MGSPLERLFAHPMPAPSHCILPAWAAVWPGRSAGQRARLPPRPVEARLAGEDRVEEPGCTNVRGRREGFWFAGTQRSWTAGPGERKRLRSGTLAGWRKNPPAHASGRVKEEKRCQDRVASLLGPERTGEADGAKLIGLPKGQGQACLALRVVSRRNRGAT